MSAFQTIIDILEYQDEPQAAARAVIEALRTPPEEAIAGGVEMGSWMRAFDAMLMVADETASRARIAAAISRIERWPAVIGELEELGCRLLQFRTSEHRWRIEGEGVDAEIDLTTGELTGLDGDVVMTPPEISADGSCEVTWTMEDLVDGIASCIQRRRKAVADKARRAAARADL